MKKLAMILILAALAFTGTVQAATQTCTATAWECNYTVQITSPEGGSCIANSMQLKASVIAFDANGTPVDSRQHVCYGIC